MNKMLPILLLVVVIGAGATIALVFRSPDTPDVGMLQYPDATPALPATPTTTAEITDDTADRDDYVETVQTMAAQLESVQTRNDKLENTLSTLNNTLDETVDDRITQRIETASDAIIEQVQGTIDRNLSTWQSQLNALKSTPPDSGQLPGDLSNAPQNASGDMPAGFGYDYPVNTASAELGDAITLGGQPYVRLQPLSAVSAGVVAESGGLLSSLSGLGPTAPASTSTPSALAQKPEETAEVEKRYTIPDTATLVGSTSMTAMLGRVPFKGKVTSPFRFKVITGPDNLATNGLRIPGIRNIVWSGYLHGVREQACVRGYLDTVTYTFDDGTIATTSVKRQQRSNNTGSSSQQYLAYISDPWGKPCIRGELFSNAGEYLRDRIIVATAAAAGQAAASSRTTTTQSASNNSISSFVSGSQTEFIAADAIAGGLNEAADYLRDIMDDAFDVVYIETGQLLTINVEREILIDYDPDGRKLAHETVTETTPSRLD